MTTQVTFDNGEVVTYDEERECFPGAAGQSAVSTKYLGPTPPKAKPGESPAAQRDRLRAELAALDDESAASPSPPPHAAGHYDPAYVAWLEEQVHKPLPTETEPTATTAAEVE